MENRKPFELKTFMIFYNLFQVIASFYNCFEVIKNKEKIYSNKKKLFLDFVSSY